MILFNKSAVNNLVLTLTEKSTVSDPIYLFLFENQQTKVKYYFIGTDTSLFKERYNQFQITEKSNANTLSGEVSLGNEGFYNYTAYQTSLSSLSGLSTADDVVPYINKTVEVGLVWVVPSATTNTEYNPSDLTSTAYQKRGYISTEDNAYILQEDGQLIELE